MERYREGVAVLAEWIRERGFEVVHANTLRTFWAVAAARRAGVPSVWSVHESEPWQTNFDHLPTDLAAAALSLPGLPLSCRLLREELHPRVERPQHVREF